MSTVDKLKAACEVANQRHLNLKYKFETEERDLRVEAHDKINEQLQEKYGKRLEAAATKAQEARIAYEDARVNAAATQAEIPLGTKMARWEHVRDPNKYHEWIWQPTKQRGVVEVFTRESEHNAGRRWSTPDIGEVVIRVLRKNGTPSKEVVRFHGYGAQRSHEWVREGEKHK
jgi:hypothetical protein